MWHNFVFHNVTYIHTLNDNDVCTFMLNLTMVLYTVVFPKQRNATCVYNIVL
jgi:hypothetical protein